MITFSQRKYFIHNEIVPRIKLYDTLPAVAHAWADTDTIRAIPLGTYASEWAAMSCAVELHHSEVGELLSLIYQRGKDEASL